MKKAHSTGDLCAIHGGAVFLLSVYRQMREQASAALPPYAGSRRHLMAPEAGRASAGAQLAGSCPARLLVHQ
jgi:hypothetical protein